MRRASAILRQDHPILPLSLKENISLGNTEHEATLDEITSAIEQGGASHFIGKLKNGSETVVAPVLTSRTFGEPDPSVKKTVKDMEKVTDLSGGESQRLSA